jgi:hypothetical protein
LTNLYIVGWLCLCATEPGDGGAGDTPAGSSNSAAPVDGNAAAAPGDDNESGPSSTVAVNQQVFLQQQMELAIKSSLTQPLPNCLNDKSMLAAIKSEMAVFECSGVRGRCLQLVYDYLQSIPPTSVEAERAFSAAGLLCTKIRSRLSDATLDTLCFLRSYYRKR